MKTTELISQLQGLVDQHGDLPVVVGIDFAAEIVGPRLHDHVVHLGTGKVTPVDPIIWIDINEFD